MTKNKYLKKYLKHLKMPLSDKKKKLAFLRFSYDNGNDVKTSFRTNFMKLL